MSQVRAGDVWRNAGRCGWVKIVAVLLPDAPGYDGALPGCLVRFTNFNGNWERKRWFYPAANQADFGRRMTERYLELVQPKVSPP